VGIASRWYVINAKTVFFSAKFGIFTQLFLLLRKTAFLTQIQEKKKNTVFSNNFFFTKHRFY
jgi:hypothetical protein